MIRWLGRFQAVQRPSSRAEVSLVRRQERRFNLGNGTGFSAVQGVIDAARRVTGREFKVVDAPRRAGDPPRLVADSGLARQELGWRPRYGDLETIIGHAWAWEQKQRP